jgi:hypothetical protein
MTRTTPGRRLRFGFWRKEEAKLKVRCEIRIAGTVDIPDCWNDQKEIIKNPYYPAEVALYHYGEKLNVEETLRELLPQMVCGDDTDMTINFSEVGAERHYQILP